ncbi:MAG: M17 family peptidase N-terminal domain-containing protein, partial [Propionibacteriaceae bacterium]|nr:M17 family peptidase N-terminal domain-containing protein [Propionibacteriaceae bacterium]
MNPISLPALTRVKTAPAKSDVVIVALTGNAETPVAHVPANVGKGYERKFGQSIEEMAATLGAKPKLGAVTVIPGLNKQRLVLVGLGSDEPSPKAVRKAAGAATRAVAGMKNVTSVTVALPADEPELLRAVVEGVLLGEYTYAPVTAEPAEDSKLEFSVVSAVADKAVVEEARTIAEAQLIAREWVNLPP